MYFAKVYFQNRLKVNIQNSEILIDVGIFGIQKFYGASSFYPN